MKILNLNSNFKKILELRGLNIDNCEVEKETGEIICGSVSSSGRWSYSSSKDVAYHTSYRRDRDDEKYIVETQWKIVNNNLVKIFEEII